MPTIVASPVTLIAETLRAVPVLPTNGSASRAPCCRLMAPVKPVAAPRMKRSPAVVEPTIVRLPEPVRAASRLMPVEALAVRVLPVAMAIGRAEPALQSGRPKDASPVTLRPEALAAALATPKFSVPAPRLIAPPKVLAPESVRVPEEALVRLPLAPARSPAKVPSLTVRAVDRVDVPRLIVPSVSVPIAAVAPRRLTVPDVSVVMFATPPTVVVPPLTVVTVTAPVMVFVPPVMEVEESEPSELVPLLIAPVRRPETVTELLTSPVIEPAETVPPVTLPESVAAVTVPALTLPETEPALTVPPVMLAPRAPTTVTLPSDTPPRMSAAAPKRVLPAPARLVRVILPVEAEKLRASAVVPALAIAPVMVRPEPEIVATEEASRAKVAAAL